MSTDFSDAVQREPAFLVDERGFRLIEVSDPSPRRVKYDWSPVKVGSFVRSFPAAS